MKKPVEQLATAFDPTEFLLKEVGEITNHQTDLPRIAKDRKIVAAIEAKLEQLPTQHDLYRGDARGVDFLPPESVHLVVTSPPYWTLKKYNAGEGQMGYIADYDTFLDELDRVWAACFHALVPGGRLVCVVGDVSFKTEKQRRTPCHAAACVDPRALQAFRIQQPRSNYLAQDSKRRL